MKDINIIKAIILTILYVLFIELIGCSFFITEYFGMEDNPNYQYLIAGLIEFPLLFLFIKKIKTSERKLPQQTNKKWYVIAASLGLTYVFIQTPLNLLYNLISGDNYHIKYAFDGLIKFTKLSGLNYISGIILIPICEELFFREYLQQSLQKKINSIYAIVIISILFALIHLPYEMLFLSIIHKTPHTAFIALFGGLITGTLYYKSKSIGPSIVMHICWNLMVIIT